MFEFVEFPAMFWIEAYILCVWLYVANRRRIASDACTHTMMILGANEKAHCRQQLKAQSIDIIVLVYG